MKYKVIKPHGGKGGIRRREGESYDIEDKEASILLRSGHIERVKQAARKPSPPPDDDQESAGNKTKVKGDE